MINNDYLACEGYENRPAYESIKGFSAFFDATENKYFFALLDNKGKVLFRSEGYPTEKARNTGIASVVKNSPIAERYSVKEENGQFLVILKAGNNKEIARSCELKSQKEATTLVKSIEKAVATYAKAWNGEETPKVEAKKEAAPKAATKKVETPKVEVAPKAATKKVETPKVEAAPKADTKKVETPKVEATPKAAAKKVETPKVEAAPKATKTVAKKEEAPKTEVKAVKTKKATPAFLSDEAYLGHPTLTDEYGVTGYAIFEGADKKFYFSVYEADGSIFQKSIGFDSQETRNQKLEALKGAIINEESYKVTEIEGTYYAQIVGANGEELSRSVGFGSFIEALLKTPKGWAKDEFVGNIY